MIATEVEVHVVQRDPCRESPVPPLWNAAPAPFDLMKGVDSEDRVASPTPVRKPGECPPRPQRERLQAPARHLVIRRLVFE